MKQNMSTQLQMNNLTNLISVLVQKKKIIFFTIGIFIIIGIGTFFKMKTPPSYSAQCSTLVLFNNINNDKGVVIQNNFGLDKKENILPLRLYPQIAQSIPFLVQLIDSNSITDSTLLRSEELENIIPIKNNFKISVDEANQTVFIEANMPTPIEAARLALKIQQTLCNYLINWYSKQQELAVVLLQNNINEVLEKIIQKQQELQKLNFTKAKKQHSVSTPDLIRLETEYQTLNTLNTTLTKQLQQKKLTQQNLSTYITTIDPVIIPNSPTNSPRSIIFYIAVFGLLGILVSLYIVIIHPIINSWSNKND